MIRKLSDSEKALNTATALVNNRYRQKYHVNVPSAWGNDPNGFIYYNNKWHLFYQCNPYSTKWDTMHWGHFTSEDLSHWKTEPIALAPDMEYDGKLGCFSGTSIELDDTLYVMYTGVNEYQQQCVAYSKDGIHFEKYEGNPVITVDMLPECASREDFRDPKVFLHEGVLYAIMCTKTEDHGNLVLFKGTDMFHWTYVGMLFDTLNPAADNYFFSPGPCECPDYEIVDGKEFLMFCPQNLPVDGYHCENIHSVFMMLGKLDFETGHFRIDSVKEADEGFDFYAPETNVGPDVKLVLIGWKEMWDRSFITAEDGWVGSFTLPRVVSVENGEIYQRPVALQKTSVLHKEDILLTEPEIIPNAGNSYELFLDMEIGKAHSVTIELLKGETNSTLIKYDCEKQLLIMDRTKSGEVITGAEENVNVRTCGLAPVDGHIILDIFVDVSSVEIFMNRGLKVMTGNVYPDAEDTSLEIIAEGEAKISSIEICSIG